MKYSNQELLQLELGVWTCSCANNKGTWESDTLQECINTAHWACEGDEIIATASNTIKEKKFLIKIKRRPKS